MYPDGAAAKDGRLKPGDQILEVNNENFRVITHQKALSVLRQTPSKVSQYLERELIFFNFVSVSLFRFQFKEDEKVSDFISLPYLVSLFVVKILVITQKWLLLFLNSLEFF